MRLDCNIDWLTLNNHKKLIYHAMQHTIKIDILNEKALDLLKNLENLNLIRLHESTLQIKDTSAIRFLKGKMTKQPIEEVERQLKELRGK